MQKENTTVISGPRFYSYIAAIHILFLAWAGVIPHAYAQGIEQKRISVDFQNISLKEALRQVQEIGGVNLVYNRALLDLDKKISLRRQETPVLGVLQLLLGDTYESRLVENNIVISPRPKEVRTSTGRIQGTVVDEASKEALPGANVWLRELNRGASVDVNGKFDVPNVPADAAYTLIVSFIGYKTQTLTNISVQAGRTTDLTINLQSASTQLTEILIKGALDVKSAEVKNSNEVSLIREIQASDLIITGISNIQISRSLDFNAAEVVQRAPGISVIDNFINVRGLYERYNMVYINNMIAPSSESDRRAFSFDLLPSGVIDKILIHRNPAPELPGDFAGGLIRIHTKEAVPARQLQVRMSTQYREGSSFTDTYGYKGSNTDWLGFDGGTRSLPSSVPARGQLPYIPNSGQVDPQVVAESAGYGRKLDKNWSLIPNIRVGPDYRGQLNYYDSWAIGEGRLNNLTSVFYTREFQTINQDYQIGPSGDADVRYKDAIFHRTARLGAMQNFVVKINDRHKIHFDNFYNQLGRDETLIRGGKEYESFSPQDSVMQVQYFWQERSLYSGQLRGDHTIPARYGDNIIQWGGGYTYTLENIPNLRRYELRYSPNLAPGVNSLVATNEGGGEGFEFNLQNYRKTQEDAISYYVNTEWALPSSIKLKAGGFMELKDREFDNRYITIRPAGNFEQQDESLQLTGPNRQYVLSELLAGNFRLDGTGFILRDEVTEGSAYTGDNTYYAGYVAISIPLFADRLKIYGGMRYEWNQQTLINERTATSVVQDVNQITRYWLPSINLSWKLREGMLVRTAYGKSLNRPHFRELSAFTNFDLDDGYVQGNPDLVTAEIQNVDLRWEYYPSDGEWISAGIFHKSFKNPIEYISATQNGSIRTRTIIRNTQGAEAYGAELEIRKNMGFMGGQLSKGFSVIVNAAYMWNRANLGADDIDYGNDLRDSRRPLQGTSPFLVNATVYYDHIKTGTAVSTQYNVFGQRLYLAASTLYSDIFELPRHSLDLNIRQRIFKDFEIQAGVKNILNQPFRYYRDFYRDGKYDRSRVAGGKTTEDGSNYKPGSDYYFRYYKEGRYYSFSISYTIR